MKPEAKPDAETDPAAQAKPSPMFHCYSTPGSPTTLVYSVEEQPSRFSFVHYKARGVCVLTLPDGTTERFRDKPARYLVVEPDPDTGELRPAVKRGVPVYLHLCREEREA